MFKFDFKKLQIKLGHFKEKLDPLYSKFNYLYSKFNYFYSKFDYQRNRLDSFLTTFFIHFFRYYRKSKYLVVLFIILMDWIILKYFYYKKIYPYYYKLTPPKYRNGYCWLDNDIPPLDELFLSLSFRSPFKYTSTPIECKIKIPKDVDILINQNIKIQIQDIEPYDYLLVFKNLPRFKYKSFETYTFNINIIEDLDATELQSPILFDELEIFLILMYSAVTKEPSILADVLHQKFINYSKFFFKFFFILKDFK